MVTCRILCLVSRYVRARSKDISRVKRRVSNTKHYERGDSSSSATRKTGPPPFFREAPRRSEVYGAYFPKGQIDFAEYILTAFIAGRHYSPGKHKPHLAAVNACAVKIVAADLAVPPGKITYFPLAPAKGKICGRRETKPDRIIR